MEAQTKNKINNNKGKKRPKTRKTKKTPKTTSATHLGVVMFKILKIMTWLLVATTRILLTPFKKMTTSLPS